VDVLATSLGNQALILKDRGDLDGAMQLLKEQERICRELGKKHLMQISLRDQALILLIRGDMDGAKQLCKEAEQICRAFGYKGGLGKVLGYQAVILYRCGDLEYVMDLLKEQEMISFELGNISEQVISLNNQAEMLSEKLNRPHEALPVAEKSFRLATNHGLIDLAKQIKQTLDSIHATADDLK